MDAGSARLKPDAIDELAREVHDLQDRVSALERELHSGAEVSVPAPVSITAGGEAAVEPGGFGDAVPAAGKALLGVAGAYLLRALTEAGTISHAIGVAAGFVWAASWLWLAVRASVRHKLAGRLNALASAVILGPLLWESVTRFEAVSATTAAAVIVGFALLAVVLCWNRDDSPVPVIITGCASFFALVLMVAARDVIPFTVALLVVAAAVEIAACFDRETSSRWFIAISVNAAVVWCSVIGGRPGGVPDGYAPAPVLAVVLMQISLITIYLASTAARTLVRHRLFTLFETAQTALAFAIGLGGAFQIARSSAAGTAAIGVFALTGAAACYMISFVFVGRQGHRDRNFYTYSTFALLLFLAGTMLLFSGILLTFFWSLFVLACCLAGLRAGSHVLELHAALALLPAWVVSGVIRQPRTQFFGDPQASAPLAAEAMLLAVMLIACVVMVRTVAGRPASWDERIAFAVFGSAASWTGAGFAAHGLAAVMPQLSAAFATLALTATAVLLSWSAIRFARPDLRWLAFALMCVAAYKLAVHDLRESQRFAAFASLLLYGGALILVPKILRRSAS